MEHSAEQTCGFVFDLDPTILDFAADLGIESFPFQLRYYGLIFAAMIYIGFVLWRRQLLRGGFAPLIADRFLIWAVVAVIAGSRLGHCLFYNPGHYLSNPLDILKFWQGGLASHGATVGLVLALFLFSRKYKFPFTEALDRFAMPTAVGAAAVRLGNFFNSEIVGRPTDLPWSVDFIRYDKMVGLPPTCRHPSQLYEFALGMLVLLALYLTDRIAGGEKRPLGLMGGVFFTAYFSGRFAVEFVKEYQTLEGSFLTMGQYLSIVPFLFGVGLLIYSRVRRLPTCELRPPAPESPENGDESADQETESTETSSASDEPTTEDSADLDSTDKDSDDPGETDE